VPVSGTNLGTPPYLKIHKAFCLLFMA
jgi:hypothetical protein